MCARKGVYNQGSIFSASSSLGAKYNRATSRFLGRRREIRSIGSHQFSRRTTNRRSITPCSACNLKTQPVRCDRLFCRRHGVIFKKRAFDGSLDKDTTVKCAENSNNLEFLRKGMKVLLLVAARCKRSVCTKIGGITKKVLYSSLRRGTTTSSFRKLSYVKLRVFPPPSSGK